MSTPTKFQLKESTRKRCKIIDLDERMLARFTPISMEFFHFLYHSKRIDFSIYFRVQDVMIEYVKPEELSKQLLDEIWDAMQRPVDGLQAYIAKAHRPRFDALIGRVRDEKLGELARKLPNMDKKTLDLYKNLSTASQMIVAGGIDAVVAEAVKASAAFLVSNTIDSDAAVSTLSRMIVCDPTLYDHSASVAMIACVIATRHLAKPLSQKQAAVVAQCALYHDVGKTCVPSAVLNKPGKFTPAEFEVMKQHAAFGFDELQQLIASGAAVDELAARVALEHHEKWDGKGYPKGRKGAAETDPENGIHLYSRIVTVADVYSALLMKRIYKAAFEPQDALKIMAGEASGFDPQVFGPFLKGVVSSLNVEQAKARGAGRILEIDAQGRLAELQDPKKTG